MYNIIHCLLYILIKTLQKNILGSSLVHRPASPLWQGQVPLLIIDQLSRRISSPTDQLSARTSSTTDQLARTSLTLLINSWQEEVPVLINRQGKVPLLINFQQEQVPQQINWQGQVPLVTKSEQGVFVKKRLSVDRYWTSIKIESCGFLWQSFLEFAQHSRQMAWLW